MYKTHDNVPLIAEHEEAAKLINKSKTHYDANVRTDMTATSGGCVWHSDECDQLKPPRIACVTKYCLCCQIDRGEKSNEVKLSPSVLTK